MLLSSVHFFACYFWWCGFLWWSQKAHTLKSKSHALKSSELPCWYIGLCRLKHNMWYSFLCRRQNFHSSTRNYEWNLERTSNSSKSTRPTGQSALGSMTQGSHIRYYTLMFFNAYAFIGQMHVFAGRVKIVSHSSCRTSAIMKYFVPCYAIMFVLLYLGLWKVILWLSRPRPRLPRSQPLSQKGKKQMWKSQGLKQIQRMQENPNRAINLRTILIKRYHRNTSDHIRYL